MTSCKDRMRDGGSRDSGVGKCGSCGALRSPPGCVAGPPLGGDMLPGEGVGAGQVRERGGGGHRCEEAHFYNETTILGTAGTEKKKI